MKSFFSLLFSAALVVVGMAQTNSIYENFGDVTEPPQIDAIAFANYGNFSVRTTLPFDFQSTRYFTNRGTMSGSPGFRFQTASSVGTPFTPALSFVNEVGSLITAGDVVGTAPGVGPVVPGVPVRGFVSSAATPSYLIVSAENVFNRGYMIAGGAGLLQITGTNVDVSRSGLGIGRLELTPTHFLTESNFFPDPGIYDNWWAMTNQFDMQVADLLRTTRTATNATSPLHAVTNDVANPFPIFRRVAVAITNPALGMVSVLTNAGGADPDTGRITNIYQQSAFVAVSDTNLTFDIKWVPSTIATNPYQTAIVEIKLADTNVVTGDLEFTTLYLSDFMASFTNYVVLTNLASPFGTLRPAPLVLTRTAPLEFQDGAPGNSGLFTNFFINPRDTNYVPIVTNLYASYSAEIDSIASRPPSISGVEIEDYPGRVEVNAQNLDLTRARLRGSALVSITSPNLVASRGVVVDSENVIFDLSVPPATTLSMQGMIKERVVRLNGPLNVWSAVWTNFFGVNATNQVEEPPGSGTFTNVVTNIVTEVDYHMLIVDATGLQATKPVTTHDFITHADTLVVNDPMTVVRQLLFDTESLTLNSRLTLSGVNNNWGSTNAPRLQSLTTKGVFTVPNIARFGYDTTNGYQGFTNSGILAANGLLFRTTGFENSGTITSRVDGITLEAQSANFQGATTLAAGDLRITATDLRFANSTNSTLGTLVLNSTRSLSDTGEGANNLFRVRRGFVLPTKPTFGDLLGTTIESLAPRFGRVEHVWAGEDRGPTTAGFENNVAIGHLVLGGDREILMSFRGATERNGLYVDMLELTGALTNAVNSGDLGAALEVDPSLTIYFAQSNVPADQLEELSNGRLVQVDFVGPASFVEIPTRSGIGSAQMERWARDSRTLDSDNDGVPNASDPYPLDFDTPVRLVGSRVNDQTSIAISWEAQPRTTYRVEYTTSLEAPDWQLLSTFDNPDGMLRSATVQDRMSGDHAQRYYRVHSGQ